MTEVRIRLRRPGQANAGINLWLTQTCGLRYLKDWFWRRDQNDFVYKFVREADAVAFALRWA